MVRRLLCLLLVEPQIREETIRSSGTSDSFGGIAFEDVVKTAQEMEDAGSRYKNLERVLGTGIVFILGKDIPETQYVHPLIIHKVFALTLQHLDKAVAKEWRKV